MPFKAECNVHAYVLMTNHVHLQVPTEKTDAVGAFVKSPGQRYLELNPVRANMVNHPAEYKWSSQRARRAERCY